MKRLHYWLRSIFGYSRTESNGFVILCLIILLFLLFPLLYPVLFPPVPFDHAADRQLLDKMVAEMEKSGPELIVKESARAPREVNNLFDFDPNLINAEQWQSLGLPKFLAERIIKYRSKGGKFRVKGDVKKIYGFPEPLYAQLHSHILLPDSISRDYPKRDFPKKEFAANHYPPSGDKKTIKAELFDINQADTLQLASVRGIGLALSRRIAKYRDLLGGFSGRHQIYEVYGLDSLVVDELFRKGFLREGESVRQLKINQATEKELDAHPYISPRLAKILVAYRVQHGNFTSVESLTPVKLLDEPTLRKLAPYLSFE
jgi:DNA uptake protein ComE-like DNA-binding protein